MSASLDSWTRKQSERYAAACLRGEHDDEYRLAGFWLCHCKKRKRLAEGRTDSPVMVYQEPLCMGCSLECVHDGDGWTCPRCDVDFGNLYDEPGRWNDDHGDDLAADLAKWEAHHRAPLVGPEQDTKEQR